MDINIAVESKSVEVYHNSVNLKEKPQSGLIIKKTVVNRKKLANLDNARYKLSSNKT